MISTKEDNLKVLFKTEKTFKQSDFPGFSVNESENGSYIVGDIYKENTIVDTINNILDKVKDEKLLILLFKKYQIIINDANKGFDAVQSLMSPNFHVDTFCLSKCTFFVDKTDTYSVELDYDFENKLDVEVSRFVENNDEILRFSESAKSILQDIIEGLEVSL